MLPGDYACRGDRSQRHHLARNRLEWVSSKFGIQFESVTEHTSTLICMVSTTVFICVVFDSSCEGCC